MTSGVGQSLVKSHALNHALAMQFGQLNRGSIAVLMVLWTVLARAESGLIISEFMASNQTVLQDRFGKHFDWIELFNAGVNPVDTDGWSLTDDPLQPRKWLLPATTVPAGGMLIVFASGKNVTGGDGVAHTSFRLSRAGEYLALQGPESDEPESRFAPGYPPMLPDISYGVELDWRPESVWIGPESACRFFVVSNDTLALEWTEPGFDDGSWREGMGAVGFSFRDSRLDEVIRTEVPGMFRRRTGCLVRYPFDVSDPPSTGSGQILRLAVRYHDGFVAYVNGREVARRNAPQALGWAALATADVMIGNPIEDILVPLEPGLIRAGRNVLAFHAMTSDRLVTEFLLAPELAVGTVSVDTENHGYFPVATPRGLNPPPLPAIADAPVPSREGGTFVTPFDLSLSTPDPETVIRFTVDGSIPDQNSGVYEGPIPIRRGTQVRARGYRTGLLPSPIVNTSFLQLHREMLSFTSDLPLIVLEVLGGGAVPADRFQPVLAAVFEPGADGRTVFTTEPTVTSRAGLKRRGSSTGGRDKASYSLEIWDDRDDDRAISLLGMPENSDWVLYGPYNFDRALIRNPFVYALSNQMGRYATRTRFCEVFLNSNLDSVRPSEYRGVYVLTEKIKRSADRVDVEPLSPEIDSEPEVSGGYMIKIDRLDPGDLGSNAGGQSFAWVYPKEEEVTREQSAWLVDYIGAFDRALDGRLFADPQRGYAPFIDVDACIDHHLINEFTKNPDGLRLSTYLYKPRNGKLAFGPVWDFDRTMGPDDDSRAADPRGWSTVFNYNWWGRLFSDPNFVTRYEDRWHFFRQGAMATDNMLTLVDALAAQVSEAQARNFARWGLVTGRTGWEREVLELKQWIAARADWMDTQLLRIRPPVVADTAKVEEAGTVVRVGAESSGTIYVTADGTDPRDPSGEPSGGAVAIQGDAAVDLTLPGAVWRYLDDSTDPGSGWKDLLFDDSHWAEGHAEFGFGDGDEVTMVSRGPVEPGTSVAYYFRKTFDLDEPENLVELTLRLRVDDGAVAHLNGVEIARLNLPAGIDILPSTLAIVEVSGAGERDSVVRDVPLGTLQRGANVLAVQVHKATQRNRDMSFDAALRGLRGVETPWVLDHSALVQARVLRNGDWSALESATLLVTGAPTPIRITEVMYRPPEGGAHEFLELRNFGDRPFLLTGFTLDGVGFRFADGSRIDPGEVIVLASDRDPAAFSRHYPLVTPFAVYPGALSNGGETLLLRDAGGAVVDRIVFDDDPRAGWPADADGAGYSLERLFTTGPATNPIHWRASPARGGSPGDLDHRVPAIASALMIDDALVIRFVARAGLHYSLLSASSIPAPGTTRREAGTLVESITASTEDRDITVTVPIKTANSSGFFWITIP